MLKKVALILGLIGSGYVLVQNLWTTIPFLMDSGAMDWTDPYASASLIYFSGMVLLSAIAIAGSLFVRKKRILGGVLLCASGLLMFLTGLLLFGIMMIVPVLIIIAAGILSFMAEDDGPATQNQTAR